MAKIVGIKGGNFDPNTYRRKRAAGYGMKIPDKGSGTGRTVKILATGLVAVTLAGTLYATSDFFEETKPKAGLETVVINEDNENLKAFGVLMDNGLKTINSNPGKNGFHEAYSKFTAAYELADEAYDKKKNSNFLGAKLAALMHRALAYYNSADSMGGASVQKKDHLEQAVKLYNEAFNLRNQLDEMGNPVPVIHTPILGYMRVAKYETIVERMGETLFQLVRLTEGQERYRHKEAAEIYLGAALKLASDPKEKEHYQMRLETLKTLK